MSKNSQQSTDAANPKGEAGQFTGKSVDYDKAANMVPEQGGHKDQPQKAGTR